MPGLRELGSSEGNARLIAAACLEGETLSALSQIARGDLFGDPIQNAGGTQLFAVNVGGRITAFQGSQSFVFAQSRNGSAIGTFSNIGGGRGPVSFNMSGGQLANSFLAGGFATVGTGYTNAPINVLASSGSRTVAAGRGFVDNFGLSGGIIASPDGQVFGFGMAEFGFGVAVDINGTVKSSFIKCPT